MRTTISLTRRAALAVALCLVLAGGVGAGIVGLIAGPALFNQIEENRTAIRIGCGLLNKAIDQSQAAANESTALLIAEIVEGMTPAERLAYEAAAADSQTAGPRKNTCGQIAARAYD